MTTTFRNIALLGTTKFNASNVGAAEWFNVGGAPVLVIHNRDAAVKVFTGFRKADQEALKKCFSSIGIDLVRGKRNTKGGNWGDFAVQGKSLQFSTGDGTVFELPVDSISQAVLASKTDVELQFVEQDTVDREDECVVEMRLYVPPKHARLGAKAASGAGSDGEEGEEAEDERSTTELFLEEVQAAGGIEHVTGDAIVEIPEEDSLFLTPRGRFALELHQSFLRMVGKTNEFKVLYKNIARMYFLPRPSNSSAELQRSAFVISLEEPIRHGQQRYAHLIAQLDAKRDDVTFRINLSQKDREEMFPGLQETYTAQLPQLVATLFKLITKGKVFQPGSFVSHKEQKSVRCSLKSNDGLLYPLDKSFFFIHKPATYIRYADIDSVEFVRTAASSARTFDLKVKCQAIAGGDGIREFIFAQMDKAELPALESFLSSRKELAGKVYAAKVHAKAAVDLSSDDDDVAPAKGGDGDEDEDSSEDSDFDEKAASASDDDDEDESDEDEDESDDSGAKKKKSKSKSKEDGSKRKKHDSPKKSKKKSKKSAGSDDD